MSVFFCAEEKIKKTNKKKTADTLLFYDHPAKTASKGYLTYKQSKTTMVIKQ